VEFDGTRDITRRANVLAMRLPAGLVMLAPLAYNYRWSWLPDGEPFFRSLDPVRWEQTGQNPVRMLHELSPLRLQRLAADPAVVERGQALADALTAELARPAATAPLAPERPLAFFCAEYGIHQSLPIYAGGLGVLAGDILKEVSDQAQPVVGVGLLYSQGYMHQRLEPNGWQHEFWIDIDAELLPAAQVRGADDRLLIVTVPILDRSVAACVWRVDVGRTPLYLLDTNIAANNPLDRWLTARLYVADRQIRLAQYALLGIGGVRALRAMGIEPGLLHLNEGHAAFAVLELVREQVAAGKPVDEALAAARERTVFTTHTPLPAGNETFSVEALRRDLGDLQAEYSLDWERVLRLARLNPDDANEPFGLTPFALRSSRAANGVSRRHGQVAREMWRPLWPGRPVEQVPIQHVTNGVHLPTWMAPAMHTLLDRFLPRGWAGSADPALWAAVDEIPDEELWALRCELRNALVEFTRERSVINRLGRGEGLDYAEGALRLLDPNHLTLGFARRGAVYKRLYLLASDIDRSERLLGAEQPIQLLISGTAHPRDEDAKRSIQRFFAGKDRLHIGARTVFLDDYDMGIARRLVAGCDVWINLPRPPLEASGTSGMKSTLNGGLQLSVLDGWWAEAYDGDNGWAVPSLEGRSLEEQDAHDAAAFFDLLEHEVVPLFYRRDAGGIPRGWLQKVKASLKTNAPRFTATRMVNDYMARVGTRVDR
jgi:starch phosphorylase